MTAAERAFWQRVMRRAARLSPRLRAAVTRGFEELRASLSGAEMARLIGSGEVDRLVDAVAAQPRVERAFGELRTALRDGVESAGSNALRALPAGTGVFNVLAPTTITAIRTLDTRVMATLGDGVRETVRAEVEKGIRAGVNPTTTARAIRTAVGLAPNQAQAVENFRAMLEAGDRTALSRALRDRRFDGTLRRALGANGTGLTAAQVDRMVDAYRSRFVAFNAETNARTAALDAEKLGQRLAWQQAVERGDVDGTHLVKTWSGVLDDREREEHFAMEGETVPWDQPYSNGQQQPGDDEFNCRCISLYKTVPDVAAALRPGAGQAGITSAQLQLGMQQRLVVIRRVGARRLPGALAAAGD